MRINHQKSAAVITAWAALTLLTVSCGGGSAPAGPSPQTPSPPAAAAPSLSGVTPSIGATSGGLGVTISGTDFAAGASVSIGGSPATNVAVVNATSITATTPAHAAGMADIVVTNPDGQSASLTGAFTYLVDPPYSLTSSLNSVTAGSQVSVSWTAPRGGTWDWIGFFKVGAFDLYEDYWYRYTDGAPSGTLTLIAPSEPGQYDFRYFLDDGFEETARTSPVVVTPITAARVR